MGQLARPCHPTARGLSQGSSPASWAAQAVNDPIGVDTSEVYRAFESLVDFNDILEVSRLAARDGDHPMSVKVETSKVYRAFESFEDFEDDFEVDTSEGSTVLEDFKVETSKVYRASFDSLEGL